jgi:hypothetical protein
MKIKLFVWDVETTTVRCLNALGGGGGVGPRELYHI